MKIKNVVRNEAPFDELFGGSGEENSGLKQTCTIRGSKLKRFGCLINFF